MTMSCFFCAQGTRDETGFVAALEGMRFHAWLGGATAITSYVIPLLDWAVNMMCDKLGVKPMVLPQSMRAPHLRALGKSNNLSFVFEFKGKKPFAQPCFS